MPMVRRFLFALLLAAVFAPCLTAGAGLYRVDFSRIGIEGGAVASASYNFTDFACLDVVTPGFMALGRWNINTPTYIPNLVESSARLSWVLYE